MHTYVGNSATCLFDVRINRGSSREELRGTPCVIAIISVLSHRLLLTVSLLLQGYQIKNSPNSPRPVFPREAIFKLPSPLHFVRQGASTAWPTVFSKPVKTLTIGDTNEHHKFHPIQGKRF